MKLQARNLFLLISMAGLTISLSEMAQARRIHSINDLKTLEENITNSSSQQNPVQSSDSSDYTQSDFYTISDFQQDINKKKDSFQDPMSLTMAVGSDFFAKSISAPVPPPTLNQLELSLLNWVEQHEDSHTIDKYVRAKHFGTWIKDQSYEGCLNTRGQVLVRDSLDPVEYDSNNHCRVVSGRWHDPYTNQDYTSSDDIQIDHVVPLKNAYSNGAWGWSAQTRCLYANFLGNAFHLLPVYGRENNSKGDSSPDKYIPPNHEYTCKYVEAWLKIKAIWKLRMSPDEASGIKQLIAESNCQKSDFQMTEEELQEQRNDMQALPSACLRR